MITLFAIAHLYIIIKFCSKYIINNFEYNNLIELGIDGMIGFLLALIDMIMILIAIVRYLP